MLRLISIAAERGCRCGDLPGAVATHQSAATQDSSVAFRSFWRFGDSETRDNSFNSALLTKVATPTRFGALADAPIAIHGLRERINGAHRPMRPKGRVDRLRASTLMSAILRQASFDDIADMRKVRESVHENRLTSAPLADADYSRAIGADGRGWVIEIQSKIVAFAVGNSVTGNIWALFVHPDHEGRGYGRRLHDVMIDWLFTQGAQRLWLTTDPDTRAQRFYESAGWRFVGRTNVGELRYELDK